MESDLNISNVNKNEINSFQQKQIDLKDENDEIDLINGFNFSFYNDIELANFLSMKFDGLNELDNYEENKNENNKEILKRAIEDLDPREIENNRNNQGQEEILEIIKRAWGDKTYRFKNSPFKRLIKPKKFSLVGRILLNLTEN